MTNTHPHYLYSDIVNSIKADKAVITAMTGLMDGTIAYATDTNEFGTYSLDTNTWTWVGASALLYVQDEGVPIGTPTTLNFVGNNVNVSMSGTVARVFVTGSSGAASSSFDNFWTSGSAGVYSIRAKNSGTVDAQGDNAFAIGNNTRAAGNNSVAEGVATTAFQVGSHAAGNGSKAYGAFSHAGGDISLASGTASFAMGGQVQAVGLYSAALGGQNNRVAGNNSVVLGGSGTVGVADDTVFVPKLNIRNIQTGTPLLNLGADVNGNVVIGTTGTGGGSLTDGWNADGNSWTFLSADAPSYVVSVNANVTGTIGVGMKNQLTHQSQIKNFFITAISVTGSTSYLTLYGGTDYTLNVTGTITNPKYSQAKSPFGFSTNPNKWSVTFTDTQQLTQANPTQNTWYNLGNLSVSVPIGVWRFRWSVLLHGFDNSTAITIQGTVSTANNSESNSKMTASATNNTGGATSVRAIITAFVTDVVELNSKTTHYFNARATTATPSNIYFSSDVVPLFFTAECAYL